jgi:hypothetical protein
MSKQQCFSRYAGIALSVLVAAGCGDAGKDEAESAPAASVPPTAAPVHTASAPADACGWIPAAEVAAIIGPLQGAPLVVRSLELPNPDASGAACQYALASQPRVGRGAVLLQVDLSGCLLYNLTLPTN